MIVEKGDLVEVDLYGEPLIGFVLATDTEWYVIKNHIDVNNHIVSLKQVVCIIKKHAIPKKYCKYLP